MPEGLVARLKHLLERHTAARFVLAGMANTVFGFLVYSAAVLADAPVWAALLAGVVAGVAFNYVTIGGYAFRQLCWRNFPRFLLVYVAVYLINLGLIRWMAGIGAGVIVAQALVTVPLAIFSYLMMRFLVFTGGGSAREKGRGDVRI